MPTGGLEEVGANFGRLKSLNVADFVWLWRAAIGENHFPLRALDGNKFGPIILGVVGQKLSCKKTLLPRHLIAGDA